MSDARVSGAGIGGAEHEPAVWRRFLAPLVGLSRTRVLLLVLVLVVAIAWVDEYDKHDVSFGVLYVFPIMLAALALRRGEIVALALICALCREQFGPGAWGRDAQYRLLYTAIAFTGLGLFMGEFVRNRRLMEAHYRELHEQTERRLAAEAQLTALVESSPAGIIAVDASGRIEVANSAAEAMFEIERGRLVGRNVEDFMPVVAELARQDEPGRLFRATTTGLGKRAGGESFHAYVWFSTLATAAGNRLAAILLDSSDDLRDWQESSLQSMLRSTRVLVGSVSHEIRNLAAAILMVHTNLGRLPGVDATEDYRALGMLAGGLSRLATVELKQAAEQELGSVSVPRLFDEIAIIAGPSIEAIGGMLVREAPADMPLVLGDHQGLIQVLMNLGRNSVRAMEESPVRRLALRAVCSDGYVYLRVSDSGPGLAQPEYAFQPFQPGANASGLGLFVSRAIVRACQGELYHEPSPSGCTMVVKLRVYDLEEAAEEPPEEVLA